MSRPQPPISQDTLDKAKDLCEQGLEIREVAQALGVEPVRLYRWSKKNFRRAEITHEPRKMPEDFSVYARDTTISELARKYRASVHTVRRWIHELPKEIHDERHRVLGVIVDKNGRTFRRVGRVVPEGFEDKYLELGLRNTADFYEVSESQVRQWAEQFHGLRERRRAIVMQNLYNSGKRHGALSRIQSMRGNAIKGLKDSAAHYLRRFKAQVYEPAKVMVLAGYRNGVALYKPQGPEGYHFVDGRGLIPTEEMIEMARSYGWQP